MKNNKGFTMVELLAVIIILGILTTVAISAGSYYIYRSRKKAYDRMFDAAINATEQYAMDNPKSNSVSFEDLIESGYLSGAVDPSDSSKTCTGKVLITHNNSDNKELASNIYKVSLCCDNYNYTYSTSNKTYSEDAYCKMDSYNVEDVETIKVLNIYPDDSNSYRDRLKNWMSSYGLGKIEVTPVYIGNYNSNPESYMTTGDGQKYDVIVFGFADVNGPRVQYGNDLSDAAVVAVKKYLDSGGSALFGHDTMLAYHKNFVSLSSYVCVSVKATSTHPGSSKVVISREGIFTDYPWQIGGLGKKLTIPYSHVTGQTSNGDIWLTFDTGSGNDVYLSTCGNNALIQTGHSGGEAEPDEQKIIANIIFYMVSKKRELD